MDENVHAQARTNRDDGCHEGQHSACPMCRVRIELEAGRRHRVCPACRTAFFAAADAPLGVLPYLRRRWQRRSPANSTRRERSEAFTLYVEAALALGARDVKSANDRLFAEFTRRPAPGLRPK